MACRGRGYVCQNSETEEKSRREKKSLNRRRRFGGQRTERYMSQVLTWHQHHQLNLRTLLTINVLDTVTFIYFSIDGQTLSQASFSSSKLLKNALYKKKISRHIKFAVHAWSIKCRRNQKLIAQFALISRDESFEPN